MPKSLLEQARELQRPYRKQGYQVTPEHIELALAWLRGEITLRQIAIVIYPDKPKFDNRVYTRMASWLLAAYQEKRLLIDTEIAKV